MSKKIFFSRTKKNYNWPWELHQVDQLIPWESLVEKYHKLEIECSTENMDFYGFLRKHFFVKKILKNLQKNFQKISKFFTLVTQWPSPQTWISYVDDIANDKFSFANIFISPLGWIPNWYFDVALWLAGALRLDIWLAKGAASEHQFENPPLLTSYSIWLVQYDQSRRWSPADWVHCDPNSKVRLGHKAHLVGQY